MFRRGSSVLFAALLLVAQLLFGIVSAGAMTHDGAQHCGGCPSSDASGMAHDMDPGTGQCGSHCSSGGSAQTGHSGCGTGCDMLASGHCGTSVSPALLPAMSVQPIVASDDFASDRRAVELPDSPLFDPLRPPTHG